jgi:hypothetical protein
MNRTASSMPTISGWGNGSSAAELREGLEVVDPPQAEARRTRRPCALVQERIVLLDEPSVRGRITKRLEPGPSLWSLTCVDCQFGFESSSCPSVETRPRARSRARRTATDRESHPRSWLRRRGSCPLRGVCAAPEKGFEGVAIATNSVQTIVSHGWGRHHHAIRSDPGSAFGGRSTSKTTDRCGRTVVVWSGVAVWCGVTVWWCDVV